ncbi:hypothetical protein SSBR45G_00540 [Bradyrhizobium sp. SSBR45G]|uniref:hypothetical protein n=1 Tax=unclassified Bradyrhizobium TaxID=2631580 RepID=UPI002342990E|nr:MULTISPECIES: hypothetical protein [unclassified Bradyrhizobium]GLH75146.1 hypothetical protein SSBR45G_00540 [Bradyrhizobium sp. SSBR45G]GLH83067.1 hypothetical protein SSBR45R_05270 [Bradyrhizobium sp. SSBR45R]
MAYTMIAERESQKIRKQRESALIVIANAQVMAAEGWTVVITDEDGNILPLAEFEAGLSQKFSSWYKAKSRPVVPTTIPGPNLFAEPAADEAEPEAVVAAELAAEQVESTAAEVQEIAEDDFETAETANAVPAEQAEHEEIERDAELAG